MGVHGLWQLVHPAGRPVTLESLEGKILAVDVSLWLHQTMKGMRDKDGNPLPNAHLQGLFSRVCKLLFYRIKPVFVFDGDVPVLKKQTLIARREKKAHAERESHEIAQKLLRNLVKSEAVKNALGDGAKAPSRVPGVKRDASYRGNNDIFELAPLNESEEIKLAMNSEAWEQEFEQQENWIREGLAVLSDVKHNSEEFKSLPMEIQHEALTDMKERQKYHSLHQMTRMPEDSDSFSAYQLKKLMKQCNLTTQIDSVRKQMANKTVNELQLESDDKYTGDEVEARRIVSEDASHYLLIKGMSKEKQIEQADRYELECKIKKEKEDDPSQFKGAMPKNVSQSKSNTMQEKASTSHGVRKRSFPGKRSGSSSIKKAKRTRSSGKHQGKINDSGANVTLGTSLLLSNLASESDDDVSDNLDDIDSANGTSSEDEGFIEVAFDPTQIVGEDELFPASIFTTTVENNKIKSQEVCSNLNLSSVSSKNEQFGDTSFAKRLSLCENEKGNVPDRRMHYNDVCNTRSANNEEESIIPKSVDLEKRKNVLNDILSELKRKKEEIGLEEDVSEDIHSNHLEHQESCSHDEYHTLASHPNNSGKFNDPCEMEEAKNYSSSDDCGNIVRGDEKEVKNASSDQGNNDAKGDNRTVPTIHHIDSDSESENGRRDVKKVTNALSEQGSNEAEGDNRTVPTIHHIDSDSEGEDGRRDVKKVTNALSEQSSNDAKGDNRTVPTIHHIDSESEDEDLKMAIELSLRTAKEDQEKSSNKVGKEVITNEDICLKDNKFADETIRDDDDDDDDFELVEPNCDDITVSDFGERDKEADNVDDKDDGESYNVNDVAIESAREDLDDLPGTLDENQERIQPEDFDIDAPYTSSNQYTADDLTNHLEAERNALILEQGKQARFATSVTEQVTLEAQELLRLFGIPYIVCPMEAEAQCAYLDITDQTQGTITDDSDIWLFGGRRMYKNFFNQNKHVEFFSSDGIVKHFGLKREQLINLALLCGSDYTEGIASVGPVRALEIMGEFPGEGLDGLKDFRNWWDKTRKNPLMKETNKLRARLRDLSINRGFPSQSVVEAYLNPSVDESKESFTWGQPDLDLLRTFAKLKFGWSREKSDQSLEPMMKQLLKRQTQGRIYSYFQSEYSIPATAVRSNRLEIALSRVQEGKQEQDDDNKEKKEEKRPIKEPVVKKKRIVGEIGNEQSNSHKTDSEKSKKRKVKVRMDVEQDGHADVSGKSHMRTTVDKKETEVLQSSSLERNTTKSLGHKEKQIEDSFQVENQKSEDIAEKIAPVTEKRKSKGRGRAGPSKNDDYKIPLLSLEVRRKGNKGKTTHTKKSVPLRSSVCLSESSSDSEASEEKESEEIQKIETTKQVKTLPYFTKSNRKEECLESWPLKDGLSPTPSKVPSLAVKGEKFNQVDMHSEERQNSKSFNSTSTILSSKTTEPLQIQDNVERPLSKNKNTSSSKSGGQLRSGQKLSKEKVSKKEECASDSNVAGKNKSESVRKEREQNKESSKEVKNINESVSDGRSTPDLLNSEHGCQSDVKKTDESGASSQVVKNPDVSLINAQTLKATLTYLNQQSREKKQLLNLLKGGDRQNAIERRMEEEEKREKMAALLRQRKEKHKTMNKDKSPESKQAVSFGDMLGVLDTEIATKGRAGKTQSQSFGNFKSKKMTTSKRDAIVEGNSKPDSAAGTKSEPTNEHRDSEKMLSTPIQRTRMRSMSGDDSIFTSQEESVLEKSKGQSKDTEVKDQRSHRSKYFDQPIKESRTEHSRSSSPDKFQYQMQHLQDSRSVKGHGYVPPSDFVERSRGLAIAGKGKGVGKNRNGRKGGNYVSQRPWMDSSNTTWASTGVSEAEIQEYAHITADDLGSDFSDSEF